jgi:hypothetical protein
MIARSCAARSLSANPFLAAGLSVRSQEVQAAHEPWQNLWRPMTAFRSVRRMCRFKNLVCDSYQF